MLPYVAQRGSGAGVVSQPDLHALLRSATADVHQRLHRHPGLAAVQDGSIDRRRYALLLSRLHGFHHSFEAAAGQSPVRSARLADDLAAMDDPAGNAIAIAIRAPGPQMPVLDGPDTILGACYVVEGSALGGRGLARNLDALLGVDATAGRSFFSGNGTDTGAAWRAFLTRLAAVPPDPATRQRVVSGAVATFAAFETWLRDWDTIS